MAKRRASKQGPAVRPVDHQPSAQRLGGELSGPIDAPAGQIAAPQPAANIAAKNMPAPAPLIQLTRNIGPHQAGETMRLTPELARRLNLQEGDYRELNTAAEADSCSPPGIEPAAWISAQRAGTTAQAQRTINQAKEPDLRRRLEHGPERGDA